MGRSLRAFGTMLALMLLVLPNASGSSNVRFEGYNNKMAQGIITLFNPERMPGKVQIETKDDEGWTWKRWYPQSSISRKITYGAPSQRLMFSTTENELLLQCRYLN